MNENLDLTKILEGCPKGTEFYCSICGKVILEETKCSLDTKFPIKIRSCKGEWIFLTKGGKFDNAYEDSECIIFPSKTQRDWAKFERFWDKTEDNEEHIITCDEIPLKLSWGKPNGEKFDVNTLHPFDKVLVRNHPIEIWEPNFFGYINNEFQHRNISCFRFYWKYCIPYNEETKHLVGTSDDCSEYYKWWKE